MSGNENQGRVSPEPIDFYIDPSCPWAWRGARWIRAVAARGEVRINWTSFSLKLVNKGRDHPRTRFHSEGLKALRTLCLIKRADGNDGFDRVYSEIGARAHDPDGELSTEILGDSLEASGFRRTLIDEAMSDEKTLEHVHSEHFEAETRVGGFGVPMIVRSNGKAIFGPVLDRAPEGDDAIKLWVLVRDLIDRDEFFELKRARR